MSRTSHRQMSESFLTAAFLSMSGGLQDAYTYTLRGHVFANAQTGNIVLFSGYMFSGRYISALHYLIPLLSFVAGVAVAEIIRQEYRNAEKLHWRQLVLTIEMILLLIVGFMPAGLNLAANAMVSFACAMQVQAFRKVNSYAFASTMCIGNLRSGMESLCAYRITHNKKTLHKSLHYFSVIFLFALGAGASSLLIPVLGLKTIFASCLLLAVSFSLMFVKEEITDNPEIQIREKAIKGDILDIREEVGEIIEKIKDKSAP